MRFTCGNGVFTAVLCHPDHHQELGKRADRLIHVEGDSGEGGSATGDGPSLVKHDTLHLWDSKAGVHDRQIYLLCSGKVLSL